MPLHPKWVLLSPPLGILNGTKPQFFNMRGRVLAFLPYVPGEEVVG